MPDRRGTRRPPAVRTLVAAVAVPTAAVLAAIALAGEPDPAGRRIEGLVLDGGPTTTGPVGNLPDPVEPIPHRTIEGADT